MAEKTLDMDKVKDFLKKQLADLTEAKQVKFRVINKAVKKEYGTGLFIPTLSATINALRPDLAKPARKAGKGRGRKPGPKPGAKRRGRPPGSKNRGPGRPPSANGVFLIKIGRKLSLAKSRDRVQAVIDKLVATGQSLGRLRIYSLSTVGVTTKVVLE